MNESNREVLRQAESIIADQQPLPALPDLKAMIVALEKEAQFVMAIKILNAAHKSNPQEEWISDQISRLLRVAANKTIAATEYISELKHIKWLLNELKANLEFGLGRKVLVEARKYHPEENWVVHQLALCTYKDEELQPGKRLQDGLELLEEIGLRKKDTDDPETLSLGGAIYKRKWEYSGQMENLYESLAFYRAAWAISIADEKDNGKPADLPKDDGYSAVNAAFILDLLASRSRILAERTGTRLDKADQFAGEASDLRNHALQLLNQKIKDDEQLPQKREWIAATLAELNFGLANYEEAGQWLAETMKRRPSEWEIQTTFKQLVSIARLQKIPPPNENQTFRDWDPAWQALSQFLGPEQTARALSCYRGKVGLALSGGGFRASFFHLGVLARLAEMDVLRSVEVLSTVSGGSIVGAHFYLEVQNELETKKDSEISRKDYIAIVRRVQQRFFAGVARNLRTKTVADFRANLRMIFSKEYSRSHRIGELYESELYSCIGETDDKYDDSRIMPDLMITPRDLQSGGEFKPKFNNWRRRAKLPVLLLNATSLNSGHSWHFTARWMGEPPGSVDTEIDVNERYRRLWYNQAPEPDLQKYRLGYAVAASACVPGLFEPLALEGLYPGRTVRLVDGGVHDNQGIAGLLDEGCTLVLCSDASGQMEDLKRPTNSIIGVPLRSNSILMDRVREAEYRDLRARVENNSLQGLFFIHLKKDLETLPIDWISCQDPTMAPTQSVSTTAYGVDKDLQRKLAAIRTDLDSFSEVEAYSLMLSGYLMTEHEFKQLNQQHQRDKEPGTWGDFNIDAPRDDWSFLDLENLLRQPPDSSDARRADIGKQLEVGASAAFKIWQLSPTLRTVSRIGAVSLLLFTAWFIYTFWDASIGSATITVGGLAAILGLVAAGVIVPVVKWVNPQKALRGYLNKGFLALTGYLISNLHLKIFDPWFQNRGKLDRLLKLR